MARHEDFVHLHLHSDFSQLDGAAKLEDIVEAAAKRGNPAIAVTDHGTMRGIHALAKSSAEHGIKPIYGVEFYVCRDMNRRGLTKEEREGHTDGLPKKAHKDAIKELEEREGIRERWHLTAWAETDEGLRNLYKLTSAAYTEGFYYKPRIDIELLARHSEGVMIGTGCAIGVLAHNERVGRRRRARQIADQLFDVFGDRLFFEFMPHDEEFQTIANKAILRHAKRYGARSGGLIITQDAHYISPDDAKHHEVLLCIGTGGYMSNPDRFKFVSDQFFLKSRDELRADMLAFHPYMREGLVELALDNTVALSERCEAKVELDPLKCLLPPVDLPAGVANSFVFLKSLCVEGWKWRRIPERAREFARREGLPESEGIKIYSARLREELAIIRNRSFEDYFLIVWDLIAHARGEGIAVGPGRGSAVGSLVSYLLGITAMDPIEHHLLFERFITADRIDMPDIDMDFEDQRRAEVIGYLFDKYGHDKVSQIATVGRLQAKQALKDVGRVLEVPFSTMNAITDLLGESEGDILETLATSDMMKKFNKKHPGVIEHAVALEGLTKTLGIHAAGVVTSPVPLTDIVPLEVRNKSGGEGVKVTAFDMRGVQDLGLLKLDVLGLRTLSVVREARELIEDRHGVELDLEEVNYSDPTVLARFTDHDFLGIFQFDTPTADSATAGVDFVGFETIVTMNALNRPGTARTGLDRLYLERLSDPELVKTDIYHPKVSKATRDTLGVMVYQEHIIRILKEVAGFAPSEADKIRKKIGKSVGAEELEEYREAFIEGAREATSDLEEDVAQQLFTDICQFGGYAFNKSHATAYSAIAYWSMYLKTYYPIEFYCALLRNEPKLPKVQEIVSAVKARGIQVLQPSVNTSRVGFTIDPDDQIRGSLVDIKQLGAKAAESIVEGQPFKGIADFLDRVDRRAVNKRSVKSLAQAGALDEILPNSKHFLVELETLWKKAGRKTFPEWLEDELAEHADDFPDFTPEERALEAALVTPITYGMHPIEAYADFIEEHVPVELLDLGVDDFVDVFKQGYIAGVIADMSTKKPPEGGTLAYLFIEGPTGKRVRVRVEASDFEYFHTVIEAGVGAPIVAYVVNNPRFNLTGAAFMVDLDEYRRKLDAGEELSIWEKTLRGRHPAVDHEWESKGARRAAFLPVKKLRSVRAYGVVTSLRTKFDKRGEEMAFFNLVCHAETIRVIAFASVWCFYSAQIETGKFVALDLKWEGDAFFLAD